MRRFILRRGVGSGNGSRHQHAYVYIHDLAREALAAAAEVHKGGGNTREAGPSLRRLRSWEFLQSLQVRGWEGRKNGPVFFTDLRTEALVVMAPSLWRPAL